MRTSILVVILLLSAVGPAFARHVISFDCQPDYNYVERFHATSRAAAEGVAALSYTSCPLSCDARVTGELADCRMLGGCSIDCGRAIAVLYDLGFKLKFITPRTNTTTSVPLSYFLEK